MSKSAFSEAYVALIDMLVSLRKRSGVTQVELARRIGKPQQFVSALERRERRVDVVEFCVIVRALGGDPVVAFGEIAARVCANTLI